MALHDNLLLQRGRVVKLLKAAGYKVKAPTP